jgi:pimeloyl-ACP methyl ester carboxylesterase
MVRRSILARFGNLGRRGSVQNEGQKRFANASYDDDSIRPQLADLYQRRKKDNEGGQIVKSRSQLRRRNLLFRRIFIADDANLFGGGLEPGSISTLIKDPPPDAPVPPILPPQEGFLFLDKAKFPASFAADVDADRAAFMADSQVPWGVGALSGTISVPAWRTKPSWYLVATQDKMIPPPAQHFMSKRAGAKVVEIAGSHAIYISQPSAVAALITQAAKAVEAAVN